MFDEETTALATRVLEVARSAGVSITTVESCTGGLVAGALTAIAGSSDVVDGGTVTYSNSAKARLGVDPAVIEAHGAVSEPVVRAMAEAGRAAVADGKVVAVAISGVAGPGGGTAQKPVGLVHFAATAADGTTRHRSERFGDIGRDAVRLKSVHVALQMLIEATA